jgi:superfamily II DNA/RNA helicase
MEGRPGPFSWSPEAVDTSYPTCSHGPLTTREARSTLIGRIIRMPARPRQNKTPDGAKRRWTPDERATRGPSSDAAAPAKGARAAKREARFGAERERSADRTPASASRGQNRGIDWYPGPRNADRPSGDRRFAGQRNRTERPQRDDRAERPERGRFERPTTGSRPERGARFDRDASRAPERGGRPERNDRFSRPERADRAERPQRSFDRSERPQGQDRFARPQRDDRAERPQRSFDRSERPQGQDRFARPQRDDRAERPQRSFDRSERPQRNDRSERPQRSFDRPQRDDRPARTERPPYQDRSERPQRTERFDRDDRRSPREERPRTEHFPARNPNRDRAQHDRRPATSFSGREERTTRFEAPQDVVLARLEGDVVTAADVAGRSFADLGLGEQITKALADLGATSPFPIQAATIPAALQGRNVLGRGRTGSGKTIAFGAALVERLLRNWAAAGRTGTGRRVGRAPRALILAPTRELALQIDRTVQPIARSVGLYTTQIVGGVPQGRQVGALVKGVDIVIGTPGRIEDLLEQGRLDLSAIEIAVLDEADHMADLGFLEPIQRLLRRVPTEGQRLMFSATLDAAVAQLVAEFLPDPDVHEVADSAGTVTADHRVLVIEQGEKLPVLAALVGSVDRSLVFARTRAFAEQLADDLDGEGVKTESLHGDLNQGRRTRNLARFSEGKVSALVATDVAARGIHVDDIELVVHADSAEDYKTYLHRSGRTGRAGASGTVVTLITASRRRRFTELLERAGIEARFVVLRKGEDPVEALRSAR